MKEGYTELLAVHDFDKSNGLDGPEHERAKTRPWRMKTVEVVEKRVNMRFEHFHTFHREDYRSPLESDATNGHVKASLPSCGPSSIHIHGVSGAPASSSLTLHRQTTTSGTSPLRN